MFNQAAYDEMAPHENYHSHPERPFGFLENLETDARKTCSETRVGDWNNRVCDSINKLFYLGEGMGEF